MKYLIEAKELVTKLDGLCVCSMKNKEYSELSKLPFKVMSFVNSMNWRMKECSEAAVQLLESSLTHPSLMLIRGAMENAAITIKLTDIVKEVVKRNSIEQGDDDDLMRLILGNNYGKTDPYVEPFDEKLRADRIGSHVKRADELYPGFRQYYSILCEFVHPNSDGVCQSYSYLDIEKGYTEFGPQLGSTHDLYNAFTATLALSLQIYFEQIKQIEGLMEEFVQICNLDIVQTI